MFSTAKLSVIIILTVLSLPAVRVVLSQEDVIDGRVGGQPSLAIETNPSIESMMSEAERQGLAVVYNTRGRLMPVIFNPLSQLITTISPLAVVKLGAIYSVAVYLMAIFFPSVFGARGRALPSPANAVLDFDYEYITKSWSVWADRMGANMMIPEPDCRYRAVCEAATYVATKLPLINEWAKKVSGAFFLNLANPYSKAWINGMMQIDCSVTYSYCADSPYRTILNKFVAKK